MARSGVSQMPVLSGPVDMLREGPRSLAYEARVKHPVAQIQATMHKSDWENRLLLLERVYGPAAAMHLKQQHDILRRVSRLPGLPSSFVALDTLLERDTSMGFEDFLGDPELSVDMPVLGIHELTERKLGMFKR